MLSWDLTTCCFTKHTCRPGQPAAAPAACAAWLDAARTPGPAPWWQAWSGRGRQRHSTDSHTNGVVAVLLWRQTAFLDVGAMQARQGGGGGRHICTWICLDAAPAVAATSGRFLQHQQRPNQRRTLRPGSLPLKGAAKSHRAPRPRQQGTVDAAAAAPALRGGCAAGAVPPSGDARH